MDGLSWVVMFCQLGLRHGHFPSEAEINRCPEECPYGENCDALETFITDLIRGYPAEE